VFFTELSVSLSWNSSLYQLSEKPENTERLLAPLKEKTMSIAMGANRNTNISAV
jgi:hypothetical protein